MDVIQRSLVLLCNTNNLISEPRLEVALDSIHLSLRKYGRERSQRLNLCREFKDSHVKVEADSALSKAVNIVTRNASHSGKVYQKQPSGNRFFGRQTSVVSGKVYQLYKYQGKGKHPPATPTSGRAVCSTDLEQTNWTGIPQTVRGTNNSPGECLTSTSTSRETITFFRRLETGDSGSKGFRNNSGIQDPLYQKQPPNQQIPAFAFSEEKSKLLEKQVQQNQMVGL